MKALSFFLTFIVIIYLTMCALLYFFQEKYIFFPPQPNKSWYEKIKQYEYYITTDFETLQGWKITNPDITKNSTIIYFGGNAEDVSYNVFDAGLFSARNLFFINMPGFGNSTGHPSEINFYKNSLQIYDHIKSNRDIDSENIFIMGRSLGASVASYIASKRNPKGLILITPFDSIENVARHYYKLFPVRFFLKHKFDVEKHINFINSPILVIASDNDGVIPINNLKNLYNPHKEKIKLIKINHASHNNIHTTEQYFSSINEFLLSN